MKVKIGEARISENGTIFGEAGDQTGKEVCTREYKEPESWEYVFRAESDDVANRLANAMLQACLNDEYIGYSQQTTGDVYSTRYGVYTAMKETGCILTIARPVNCDCSSLVASCCIISGVDVSPYMSTYNEENLLDKTKAFKKMKYTSGMKLCAGDVLLRRGHTAIVVESDQSRREAKYVAESIGYTRVYKDELLRKIQTEWALLGAGNLVDVYDEEDGISKIRIGGKVFGYCLTENLRRV